MFRNILIIMGTFVFLGCSSGRGETDQKKLVSKDRSKRCGLVYERVLGCSKESLLMGEMDKAFGEKGKFVTECKNHWKEAEEMTQCAEKTDCREFTKCLLKMSDEDLNKMEELQRLADMPADAPEADMPADAPETDMPADAPPHDPGDQ